ncbi:MAG: 1-deoxy-D-xylulose-5-phosphate reductoisomerase [Bacillota bacterium]|nr:MAG: 1-deoxy-D-xylulose-5-phosphate reductoisomerase [Bacillota bacterium]
MKKLIVLGSTGSIGTSTLDVVRRHPTKLNVVALCAGRNIRLLLEQIAEFRPEFVAICDQRAAQTLKSFFPETAVFSGENAAEQLVLEVQADLVVAAISGMAGLRPVMAAVDRRMNIALANKESLVAAGEILLRRVSDAGVNLLPVDSEHSAIWQAMHGWPRAAIRRLILTASGGPFYGRSRSELYGVDSVAALKHPTWKMGGKISIDSATLMNKGLEVIEAHHLFSMDYDQIDVLVHPQSIVHSIVEYVDGSQLAQLSKPDMRIPIQVALAYPERWEAEYTDNDYHGLQWNFFKPDLTTFPSLRLAIQAGKLAGAYPAILNAANEVAVAGFLEGRLPFLAIPEVVEDVLCSQYVGPCSTIDDVFAADEWARAKALTSLKQRAV